MELFQNLQQLTMALISMLHHWFHETDGNGSVIKTILFDYRKAFDLIDHSILFGKLSQLDIPRSVANWIIDFLTPTDFKESN